MMKSLQDPVSVLKGVGPKRVADLATLNIDTIEDLLTYYPTRYDDFTANDLSTVKDKQRVTIKERLFLNPYLAGLVTVEIG